jgi:hypothetical protein
MSTRRELVRAMTRKAEPAVSGTALVPCKIRRTVGRTILGGLLLLSTP